MDTVLAGQDGKSPAIDQTTGQPLTIEELLRRRGLLAVGGNTRLNGQAPQAGNPLAAALAARTGAMPTNGDATVQGVSGSDPNMTGTPPAVVGGTDGVNALPAVVNGAGAGAGSSSAQGAGGSIDPTGLLQAAAVGGGAGLGYALASRRKKSKTGPAGLTGADTKPHPKPGQLAGGGNSTGKEMAVMPGTAPNSREAIRQHGRIEGTRQLPRPPVNAEFSEVNPLIKALTDKRVARAITRIR